MKKVKDFIKQKSTILQLMFVASVLILVLVEISKIIRDVDWNQVSDGLLSQSIFSIIMMLILGMFSVTPAAISASVAVLYKSNFASASLVA